MTATVPSVVKREAFCARLMITWLSRVASMRTQMSLGGSCRSSDTLGLSCGLMTIAADVITSRRLTSVAEASPKPVLNSRCVDESVCKKRNAWSVQSNACSRSERTFCIHSLLVEASGSPRSR
jgi:hypothetical protein